MNEKHLIDLLDKHNKGLLSEDEQEELFRWYGKQGHDLKDLSPELIYQAKATVAGRLGISYHRKNTHIKTVMRYAAVLFCILGLSAVVWVYTQKTSDDTEIATVEEKQEILPGKDKAMLTLIDGSTIDIEELAIGQIKRLDGFSIMKTEEGKIKYLDVDTQLPVVSKNILEIPFGGQYHVVLSDGTKVWLNAGSKLTYPVQFDEAQRVVDLEGEGYFEVAKQNAPFKVKSGVQLVEVLGTHFNINAYKDEDYIKTTLLEGSVKIRTSEHRPLLLKVGQQSVVEGHDLSVKEVEVDEILAWKNNFIQFSNNNLEEIMRQISRWYNVEVVFEDESMKTKTFSGKISKYESVNQVLDMLSMTESVRFSIEGRRINVMN